MAENLVIVESPAKARTIKKYLGKDFEVLASYGHVRDLVPKEGAVDPKRKFAMRYQPVRQLVLRGAVSNGFRAPGLAQSWYSHTTTAIINNVLVEIGNNFTLKLFHVGTPYLFRGRAE